VSGDFKKKHTKMLAHYDPVLRKAPRIKQTVSVSGDFKRKHTKMLAHYDPVQRKAPENKQTDSVRRFQKESSSSTRRCLPTMVNCC
jgi:hypothetical protein